MQISDMNVFNKNKQAILRHITIHPEDVVTLDSSINELIEAGVGVISNVTVEESDTWNWVLLLTNDDEQVFYLELSDHGSISVLKKDGSEGEVIIDFLCDDIELIPNET